MVSERDRSVNFVLIKLRFTDRQRLTIKILVYTSLIRPESLGSGDRLAKRSKEFKIRCVQSAHVREFPPISVILPNTKQRLQAVSGAALHFSVRFPYKIQCRR
eukprot:COSAG02_NODE_27_length_51735_cov_86.076749_12_plen_103_part_00